MFEKGSSRVCMPPARWTVFFRLSGPAAFSARLKFQPSAKKSGRAVPEVKASEFETGEASE